MNTQVGYWWVSHNGEAHPHFRWDGENWYSNGMCWGNVLPEGFRMLSHIGSPDCPRQCVCTTNENGTVTTVCA